MDEVGAAAASSVAAGEALAAAAPGNPEQQQVIAPIPGARNYGYSDDFMMYAFKVEMCSRTDKHPRGSCPYAHPGDVARRRHPSRYQALLCPEVRAKKVCPRLEDCQCSHSAFEFWLHPDRYRTSVCEKGVRCSRPVCFFAHNEEELRPLPAGLRPAAPEEGTSSSKRISSSSGSSSRAAPGSMMPLHQACIPVGLSGGLRYVQQQQQPQQLVLQPGMQLMPVAAPAGASPGYASVGYMPVMQPGTDGAVPVQYGQVPGRYYAAEQLQGGAVMMVPASQQQQQYVMHPAQVGTPGVQQLQQQRSQLPEVMQQFQQLVVASAPMGQQYDPPTPAAAVDPSSSIAQWPSGSLPHSQQQVVMMMPPGGGGPQQQQQPGPYMQQQVVYLSSPMEQGSWPQMPQQQQQYQQQQYQQQQYQQQQGPAGGYDQQAGGGYGGYRSYAGAVPSQQGHHPSSGPGGARGRQGSSGLRVLAPAAAPGVALAGPVATPTSAAGMMTPGIMQQGQQGGPLSSPSTRMVDAHALANQSPHAAALQSSVLSPSAMLAGGEAGIAAPMGAAGVLGAQPNVSPMVPQQQQQPGMDRANW